MIQNRPLVYLWIARYNDGTELYQFDKTTFKENAFGDIDQAKLVKFGLYSIPKDMEAGIKKAGNPVVSIPFLPTYEINLTGNRRVIYYRDVFISQEEYHSCLKCNREFLYGANSPKISSKYPSPICPNCGAHDLFICKSCGHEAERFEKTSNGLCSKCQSHMDRVKITSNQYSREKRWNHYILGAQETVNGKNFKFMMRIKESGDCEVV